MAALPERSSAFLVLSALLSISGCSHTSGTSSPLLPAQSSHRSTSGGPFTASYSGRGIIGCYGDIDYSFTLKGEGYGTFVQASTLLSGYGLCQEKITWHDTFTITSTSQSGDSINVSVSGKPTVCEHDDKLQGSYTISGGSGKFASATGSGSVTLHLGKRHFQAHFNGTLTF